MEIVLLVILVLRNNTPHRRPAPTNDLELCETGQDERTTAYKYPCHQLNPITLSRNDILSVCPKLLGLWKTGNPQVRIREGIAGGGAVLLLGSTLAPAGYQLAIFEEFRGRVAVIIL